MAGSGSQRPHFVAVLAIRDDSVRGQIDRRKAEGEEIKRRMAALEREGAIPLTGLTNQKIDRFAAALAQLLRTGDIALRRAYMNLFIDDIEAKDGELRLTGSEEALAAAVASGQKLAEGGVHAFVREWRPHGTPNAVSGQPTQNHPPDSLSCLYGVF